MCYARIYILQSASWTQHGYHTLTIDGLYNENHVFINGGKVKAYPNGTIDLNGSGPTNSPEC